MNTAPELEKAPEMLAKSPLMNLPQVRALIHKVLTSGMDFNTLEREFFQIFRALFA
jgi:hypothetical protein